MNTIIGADAAKLAGLQVDMLQKMRDGQMTLEHLEWFNKLRKEERDQLSGIVSPDPRLELLATFIVKVPRDYDPATYLTSFRGKHYAEFYSYNDNVNDANFAKATQKLVPGKTYTAKIWGIRRGQVISSPDCLAFYKAQKAVLVGAQGLILAWEQKKEKFPKGKWTVSLDEKDALPFLDGVHGVPDVDAGSDGDFKLGLGFFENDWDDDGCLLCFCDEAL